MDKLLPCPHCNGPAEWSPGNYKGIPTCQHCRSTAPDESTWNRRSQPEVAGWQPIETAPKDGTEVLAAGMDYGTGPGCYLVIAAFEDWLWTDTHNHEMKYLTHWMPLPEPPKED